jgi:flavorubredoxin
MTITDTATGTNVEEIAEDLYRISTPVDDMPGGFTFNQFLLVDDEPLLFHTGPRRLFALTQEAVRHVIPPEKMRWIAFSHVEADECGALNEWLAAAPNANPLCGRIAAMVSIEDLADREPRGLDDGERVAMGRHTLTWLDAPHLPHSWECGYLFDERTRTLLCGDLLTQPGSRPPAVTESDAAVWEPSEGMRKAFSYYADLRNPASLIDKLAATEPELLACMHGSSYRGKGAPLLRRLGEALSGHSPEG